MKILFDHTLPFALAHGGFQIQIEQTMAALQGRGLEVEPLRWWDENQRGDIIHFFGRPDRSYIDLAHAKGMKVIVAELHSALGSRSTAARFAQKMAMRVAQAVLPGAFTTKLAWDAYRNADAFIALTEWEAHIMRTMFDADPARIHVIGNGVEDIFRRPHRGGDYLVCTAAIHPRKRVVELARAAAEAQVRVWIIGKPYAESDPYYGTLLDVQRAHPDWVRYEGPMTSREKLAETYAGARGFVLLSTQETLSLSAYEAAAAGCPVLLSDQPWARTAFGDQAHYVPVRWRGRKLGVALRTFYDTAAAGPATLQPPSWPEVARQLVEVYKKIMR